MLLSDTFAFLVEPAAHSFANLLIFYSTIKSLKTAISQVETYARRQHNN